MSDNTWLMQYGFAGSAAPNTAHSPTGHLRLIRGCMFAGKTEELIDHVLAAPAVRTSVFKHRMDDRYHSRRVVSHRRRSCDAIPVASSGELLGLVSEEVEFVAIDEGHFFDDRLPDVCRRLVKRGLVVLITTLDKDSWGQPFPMIDRLCGLANRVTVKSAVCGRCGRRATYTQRLTPIIDGNMVGGPGVAEPRCVQCWAPPGESYDQITRLASNTGPWLQHSS